jgi:hypothetical protein
VDQNNHLPIHKLFMVVPVEEQDMVEEVNLKRGQGRNSCLRKKPYNLEGGWFSKQKSLEGEWFLQYKGPLSMKKMALRYSPRGRKRCKEPGMR